MPETEIKDFPRDRSAWYISAMEHLVDVIEDLSQAYDLDTVMRIVRTAARHLSGADGATFVLRDDGKCYYADEDAISPLWKGQRFPLSSCISGWSMLNKAHVVIEDIYQDSRIPADAYRPTFVKSLAMVPIRQSDPIGAIGAYWAHHRIPTDDEIRILKMLANATSVAIENVELYTRLQKELQAVERTILDNTVEGIITVDINGTIIRYNQACKKIFGYEKNEVLGQNIRNFLPPQHKVQFEELFNQYLSDTTLHINSAEILLQRKNAEPFPAEFSMSPIQIGKDTYFSGIIRDISDRKAAEEKLHIAHEDAERANQAKSDFLAHMSHELRTPLNSIIGLNRMLYEDHDISREQQEMAGISYRSAQNLLEIVNDILDLSKIEAGKLELESIVFSLEEVVHNVIETLLPQCSEKGLTLMRDFNADNIPYFVGDPLRLGRILMNLVGNAIKYTESGTVHLHVSWKNAGPGQAIITGEITDTGIGIADDKIDGIFKDFAQADTSITRRYGGTGLGLAITREIVEKMGGTIGVESVVDEGSTFWFEVPMPTADTRPDFVRKSFRREVYQRQEHRIQAHDIRLLIAEDHSLNQAFMKKLLPRMGIRNFTIVDNGQAMVEAVTRNHYDMILADCHMPILSGYDATVKIRNLEAGLDKHLPIIAMTADAMIGTRERCLKSGMDDYITKPLNQDELRYVMEQWIAFQDEEVKEKSLPDDVIDFSILSQFSDTEEEMQSFVNLFLEQSAVDIARLEKNCTGGKNTEWLEAAHRLKGSTAMLGAEKLRILCAEAQDNLEATQEERRKLLGKIQSAYNNVTAELQRAAKSSQEAGQG